MGMTAKGEIDRYTPKQRETEGAVHKNQPDARFLSMDDCWIGVSRERLVEAEDNNAAERLR